jgi:hypothetical protein
VTSSKAPSKTPHIDRLSRYLKGLPDEVRAPLVPLIQAAIAEAHYVESVLMLSSMAQHAKEIEARMNRIPTGPRLILPTDPRLN